VTKARAGTGKRTCSACGNAFIGRASASYCSPACKQRAHRSRKGANRNAPRVTVLAPGGRRGHSAEAVALLAELDLELSENSADLGLISGSWSPAPWTE